MSPMLGAEQDLIDRWVETNLKTNAVFNVIAAGLTTRVFNAVAPKDATLPVIVYQAQDPPRDVRGVGTARVMVEALYIVKAIGMGVNYNIIAPIANEIDRVMTLPQSFAVADGFILASVRDSTFSLDEEENGEQFRHLGGNYRIHAQATS